ncbi:PIF1 helicase, partial [Acromyrmex heyeri]
MDIQFIGVISEFLNCTILRSLNDRECGAFKVADTLLGNSTDSDSIVKKRKKCYLINHYRFNVKTESKKYFYSLLLLFKSWKDLSEIRDTLDQNIHLKKATAISAPTGIAVFSIDGLTIHGMFQLPVTHESTAKQMHLSDMVLKTELFIIDEVKLVAASPCKRTMFFMKRTMFDDQILETAGIERVIAIKIGAKVMIRRNIDVTLGLVNGTIGNVVAVNRSSYFGKQRNHNNEKQFPLFLSYGITIHKSKGITYKNTMMDPRMSVFSDQAYVGLSRMKLHLINTLEGLHLINFNQAFVKANSEAIVEYNRLRSVFKAQLPQIHSSEKKAVIIHDYRCTELWDIICDEPESTVFVNYCNDDHVSCYANVILQCAFHCVRIRQQILKNKVASSIVMRLQIRRCACCCFARLGPQRVIF